MYLPALFHWAPAGRRADIERYGLVAGSAPTVSTEAVMQICLATDPQRAWQLSGAMDWVSEIDAWDLWQIALARDDEVVIRSEFGPEIVEVAVRNSIPAERVWYVGRRSA